MPAGVAGPVKRRLYEITADQQAFEDLLVEIGGEWNDEVQALYDELEGTLEQKVSGYCAIIAEQEAHQASLLAESKRLAMRAHTAGNVASRLKDRLNEQLGAMGRDSVETEYFAVRREMNPRSVEVLVPANELPREYRRDIPASAEPDKKAIAAWLKANEIDSLCVPGRLLARYADPTYSLRIR